MGESIGEYSNTTTIGLITTVNTIIHTLQILLSCFQKYMI